MTALLDSNVLIALVVESHVHHRAAEQWVSGSRESFATCPITEGALVRLLIREGQVAATARRVLDALGEHPRHTFWADSVSYRDVPLDGVIAYRQVSDAYLVHLAQTHQARLVTFDRGLAALHGDHVELVSTT